MRLRAGVIGFVLITVIAVAVVGGSVGLAQAAPASGIALTLNGKALSTAGQIVNDTAVVPLAGIAADLGLTYYGPSSSGAEVSYGDKRVTFTIGGDWATVSGHEVLCPFAVVRQGDQVLVPLRFLVENLGFAVKWTDGATRRIDIVPVTENPIVIGTVRERRETATLRIDMQYPKLSGLDAAVQAQLNAFFADRTAPAIADAEQSERDNIADGLLRWPTELFLNYNVAYNQQNLLSMTLDDYIFMGGAHGSTIRSGCTVDIKTGVSYALKDLFLPGTDYVNLISTEVAKQIAAEGLAPLEPFSQIRADQDFYIKDGNLVVYFQQYELMAYAYGFPEFRIPLTSLKNVLVPELAARSWTPAQ